MNLRKIVGECLIGLGALGLLGGLAANSCGNYLKEKQLSDKAKAIYSVSEAFYEHNFTFSREYHESPDVIETKREIRWKELGEPISDFGLYGGILSTFMLGAGILTIPTTKNEDARE